jgi:hypothetical protein
MYLTYTPNTNRYPVRQFSNPISVKSPDALQSFLPLYYQSNGDINGLIYYIGTNKLQASYTNPFGTGIVLVNGTLDGTVFDRNPNTNFLNQVSADTVIRIDGYKIKPNRLSIGSSPNSMAIGTGLVYPRRVYGSEDGITWFILASYTGGGLNENEWWSPTVTTATFIRFIRFGSSTDGEFNQMNRLGEFEIYGDVIAL